MPAQGILHAGAPEDAGISSDNLAGLFTKPPGKLYLLHGDPAIFQFSLWVAMQAIMKGSSVAVVDGCNRFDVEAVIRFARERRRNPDEVLRQIFISRSFTCYQMEQTVASRLPSFLESIGSTTAIIFGLLDTFYDEQAPFHEVRQILQRLLVTLREMKAAGISVLLASLEHNVLPKERNQLFTTLKTGVDHSYRLQFNENHHLEVFLEQGGMTDGTNRTDLYQHHRQRTGKLVQIPSRASKGGPGVV
ncbi:MAG: hypothetical protein WBD36_00795 [Bacteroidota bacterium]